VEYTFLIVDDEEIILQGISQIIELMNDSYKVIGKAQDVMAAIIIYNEHKPDIVITDMNMHDMDGLNLINELNIINPQVKIIVVSGYDDFNFVKSSLKMGVADYLLKPVSEEELLSAIEKVCLEINKTDSNIDHKKLKIIEKSKEYIDKNYMNPISLKQVSDYLGISPTYLSEIFTIYNNDNFVEYITNVRINKAKELLSDPVIKVYEVGSMVGYEDSAYFSRVFKKVTGLSPVNYQKKHG